MVVSVSSKSSSKCQFETQQLWNPKHGIMSFGRSTLLAIAQIVYMGSHEHKKGIRINWNKQNNRMQKSNKFEYVCMYRARFSLLWSITMVYSYSYLPPEHVWMAGRGWERLEKKIRIFKILEIFCKSLGLFLARVSSLGFVHTAGHL